MRRRLPALAAAAFAVLVAGLAGQPEPAGAVCSVLSHHPCTPYFCGIHSGSHCIPDIFYPLNQVPVLKVQGHVGPSEPLDRDHPADQLNELGPLLSKCLELPPDDEARNGMRVTLKLAFKRNGELLAEPRFTYVTREAPPDVKAAYRDAAIDMLKRCTPLPITDGLGSAIAGRPFVIPIIETRKENKDDAQTRATPSNNPDDQRH